MLLLWRAFLQPEASLLWVTPPALNWSSVKVSTMLPTGNNTMQSQLLTGSGDGRKGCGRHLQPAPVLGLGAPISPLNWAGAASPARDLHQFPLKGLCSAVPSAVCDCLTCWCAVNCRTRAAARTTCRRSSACRWARLSCAGSVHADAVCRNLTKTIHDMQHQHGRRWRRYIPSCSDARGSTRTLSLGALQGPAAP